VAEPARSIYNLTYEQLAKRLADWGEPSFRVQQVWQWLYQSLVTETAAMRNIPLALRRRLEEDLGMGELRPVRMIASQDQATKKWLFELADGETIETVLMQYRRRRTACISAQVGCAFACTFCATGQMGLHRNLTAGEIVQQVLVVERFLREEKGEKQRQLTNIVFMGMGEPLANYRATLQAVRTLRDARGLAFAGRRITLSTVGLVPAMRRLANEGMELGLAISLHAPTDELRDQLVPINRQFPLAQLMDACRDYANKTGRRLTFEYTLIRDVNDGHEQARQLVQRLRGLLCHLNIIPLNPVSDSAFQPPARTQVDAFRQILEERGISVTVRMRRGIDIQAGCGQLRSSPPTRHQRQNAV